jgi:hypothetical protein
LLGVVFVGDSVAPGTYQNDVTLRATGISDVGQPLTVTSVLTLKAKVIDCSDTSAPLVSVAFPDPLFGSNGWFSSDDSDPVVGNVTAADLAGVKSISCTGAEMTNLSGLGTPNATADLEVTGDGIHDVHCTATDNGNNSGAAPGSTSSATVRIDRTAPVVSCGTADGLWHADNVAIPCTAADGTSGLTDPADAAFALVTYVANGEESWNALTDGRTVTDVAGNSAMAGPVGGNQVDRKGPEVTISSPHGTYLYGEEVTADFWCTDSGSGVASCEGEVEDGAVLDTTTAGNRELSVHATDQVGNTGSGTSEYSVVYGFGECDAGPAGRVLQPVNADGSSVVKRNSTVPVKFRVCDADGSSVGTTGDIFDSSTGGIFAQGAPVLVARTATTDGADEVVVSTAASNEFRWDANAEQWVFNHSTKNLTPGSRYTYRIQLNSGQHVDYSFSVR